VVPDIGGNLFEVLEKLLAATSSIVVATGILNLWMHDPEVTAERFHAFVEQFGPRVLFGIGVSHARLIDSVEADRYRRPLAKTREYLEALDTAEHPCPPRTGSSPPWARRCSSSLAPGPAALIPTW